MKNTQKQALLESEKYSLMQRVRLFKVSRDGNKMTKSDWFRGVITSITSRGLIVNPINEDYDGVKMGLNLDILAGSFVPFPMFNPKVTIQIENQI